MRLIVVRKLLLSTLLLATIDISIGRLCEYAGIYVCCTHYYETATRNCKECPIGYTSSKGVACYHCQYPYYGNRCALKCLCNEELCDFKQGCSSFTRTTQNISIDRKGTSNTQKGTVTYPDWSHTNKPSNEKTGKDDDDKIVLYVGAVGLLVMAILIGMLLNGVKNKYCSRQIVPGQKDDDRHQPTEASHEMYSYEYIDEQQIADQNPFSVPPSLPVPRIGVPHQFNETSENNHNDSVDARNCIRAEDEGYLNPYQPVQLANIYKHEYKVIGAEITTNKNTDEYLHPYNSLMKSDLAKNYEYKDLRNENIKSEFDSSESNTFQSFV